MLKWIQQRSPNLLRGDNLEKFQKADIDGAAFLGMTPEYFKQYYDVSIATGAGLKNLADEVKEKTARGKSKPPSFIPCILRR